MRIKMKANIKTYLLGIIILLVGFAMGVFSTGWYTKSRIDKSKEIRTEKGFMEKVYKNLQLELDSVETQEVRAIMKNFARRNHQYHNTLHDSLHQSKLNLEMSLSQYLNADEMRKLERLMKHQSRGHRPPPPPHKRRKRH